MSFEVNSTLPLINQRYKPLIYTTAAATGLAAAAVIAPSEAIRIIGMTTLIGIGYGVMNDMMACRDCIEYFTVGHFYDERNLEHRPLNTLNPSLNAIAWGAIASWHTCAVAGALLSFFARAPFLSAPELKVTAAQLAPYLATSAAFALFVSHVRSRQAQKEMANKPWKKHPGVPIELQPGWEACHVRNLTGYVAIGIVGTILSVAMIAARRGLFTF